MNSLEFNLNPEQQIKFNEIYEATNKLYPHLCSTDIDRHRIKVLIAYSILTDDKSIIEEIDKKSINVIEEPQGANEE